MSLIKSIYGNSDLSELKQSIESEKTNRESADEQVKTEIKQEIESANYIKQTDVIDCGTF